MSSIALVAEIFRLSWMDSESHFFCTSLEFAYHFLELFFGGCKKEHVASKTHVCEAVMIAVAQSYSHVFPLASMECLLPMLSAEPC